MSSPEAEPALIVNTWVVQDGAQEEFVGGLVELFEHLGGLPGFLGGQILQGSNPTRYISMATMGSGPERRSAIEEPKTRELLRSLRRMAHPDAESYTALRGFGPADGPQA